MRPRSPKAGGGDAVTRALAFSWRTVRCRRCGGMDCPGCIDGPIFCRRPDPAVDQGAEPMPEVQPEASVEQPRVAPSDYQAELAFWSMM